MTTLARHPGSLEMPFNADAEVDRRTSLTPADLAELISSFNEVTSRLQRTHESLRDEVARLEGELRDAQSQLRRARQLAALGEMAAGIAHEVRNPLGSIRLYASALAQDLTGRPEEQSLATRIIGAVGRLNAVVGDVLTFAREIVVRDQDIEASELIRDSIEACADVWSAAGIEVCCRGVAPVGAVVRCDPALTHQALVNVLRNAAEAMGESEADHERALTIRAERRDTVNAQGEREAMIAIIVRDTGPGVPAEALDRLFNPFFTTRHTGTGLGLAIVHRIVDAHGGRVSIRNNSEVTGDGAARGAYVEVLLPSADELNQQEETP